MSDFRLSTPPEETFRDESHRWFHNAQIEAIAKAKLEAESSVKNKIRTKLRTKLRVDSPFCSPSASTFGGASADVDNADALKITATTPTPKKNQNYWQEVLRKAALDGDLANVTNALENNANIDSYYGYQGKFESTAMTLAAKNGHLNIVKYLMEKGANPYLIGRLLPTPLEAALENNCKDIANYLHVMMRLPEILNRINRSGFTPLGYFIKSKYDEGAIKLIELGADLCKIDRHGKTPLVYAVESKSTKIFEKLLENGAGASCLSALQLALTTNSDEMTKLLIKSKPEVINAYLDDGCTPLTKVLDHYNLEMAKYLIENGADPTKQDENGNFPIDQALEMNSIEIAEILFSKKANVKFPLEINPKLLKKLAENNRLDVYRFLVKNHWNIEQCDENGKTSLALSAAHQHLLLTEFLIENGAHINKAGTEIRAFRRNNRDFNHFMDIHLLKERAEEKWQLTGTGQE